MWFCSYQSLKIAFLPVMLRHHRQFCKIQFYKPCRRMVCRPATAACAKKLAKLCFESSSDAYYVMRCLVVFGYRCAPPQRLVLSSLLRSGVRARRCSVCRRLARTGGKLERRRPTTESGFFKKLQENLILVPTVNFKAVKLVVH